MFVYSSVAGNAVIFKALSRNPLPPIMFAKLMEQAGFPRDAFALFTVPGSEAGRLVVDDRIHVVGLTGSSETGKRVLAVGRVKQYVMDRMLSENSEIYYQPL